VKKNEKENQTFNTSDSEKEKNKELRQRSIKEETGGEKNANKKKLDKIRRNCGAGARHQ